MRSAVKFLLPTLALSLVVAACGSSGKSGSSSQATTTPAVPASSGGEGTAVVKTASNATLHATVLVNAQGMTLYSLSGEGSGKFICTSSACVGVWHPLSASSAAAPSGAVGSLGTVKRPDGTEQVTYKGMPLYTFAQDQKPGETGGQGIKDVGTWTAVKLTPASSGAAGSKTTSTTTTTPTTTTPPAETPAPAGSGGGGSGGGGYGY
jgi:predicted lipoprotein with Yx(FWY)xxD motif